MMLTMPERRRRRRRRRQKAKNQVTETCSHSPNFHSKPPCLCRGPVHVWRCTVNLYWYCSVYGFQFSLWSALCYMRSKYSLISTSSPSLRLFKIHKHTLKHAHTNGRDICTHTKYCRFATRVAYFRFFCVVSTMIVDDSDWKSMPFRTLTNSPNKIKLTLWPSTEWMWKKRSAANK